MLLAGAVSASSPRAHAQAAPEGFVVNRLEPSEAGSDWITQDSLDFRGRLRPAVRALGDWQYRPLATYTPEGDLRRSIVRNQIAVHAGASVVLFERLRLAASLPLVAYADGHGAVLNDVFYTSPAHDQSVGDLRLALDARIFGEHRGPVSVAVGGRVWAPTGRRSDYTSDGALRIAPHLAAAGDVGPLAWSARAGFSYRDRSDVFAGAQIGSEIVWGAAVGFRAVDGKVVIGPEVFGSNVVDGTDQLGRTRTSPIEGLLGVRALLGSFRPSAGFGAGITRGYGTPEARFLLGLELVPAIEARSDRDGDGIDDAHDACPEVRGLRSADPRRNGCPAPLPPIPAIDSDGDGIDDADDACPDVRGPRSADRATSGCPRDADRDGIVDEEDACPAEPGMKTADPRTNGCADRDGDGVFDKDDACKDAPGKPSADPAKNGCPETDRDGDGVLDSVDACPDAPGEPSSDPAKNGCPKAEIKDGQIRILEQVKFKTDSAVIEGKESEEVLRAILAVLVAHPEIARVRVEGHTDDQGKDARNRVLSAERAAAVVSWLVSHGVDKKRLSSVGLGSKRPLVPNDGDDGRRQNRRVELHIEAPPAPPAPKPAPKK